jgi:hypothetical protein
LDSENFRHGGFCGAELQEVAHAHSLK